MEKKDYLICVDMQNDFIDGSLANPDAAAIVPNVVKAISEFNGEVIATRDTHSEAYYDSSLEGQYLPSSKGLKHCIRNTNGWEYNALVKAALDNKSATYVDKITFGYTEWASTLLGISSIAQDAVSVLGSDRINSITVIGTCTDICVLSNVAILRALFPNVVIRVIADCCAGLTKEKHDAALEVMRSIEVEVI